MALPRTFHPGWPLLTVALACGQSPQPAQAPEELAGPALTASAPLLTTSGAQGPSMEAALPSVAPAAGGAAPFTEEPSTLATPAPPRVEEAAACPEAMVLVDGEYCTDVEHECLRHWYSDANKKKVCEEFAPTAKCVGDRVHKRFCVDRYAWPNVAGERPEVMNNFYQAQVKCAAVGKRLCTESEWTMSCEGPDLLPFPYGFVRDVTKCNGDRPWDRPNMIKVAKRDPKELARLWQGVRSGTQPECVSGYGVHDLPGNNDEVVASETYSPAGRARYDSVNTGGPWYKGVRNQCRPKIYTHDEGFYYYYLGFRCCAEPEGEATDPRAPKQRKRGWDFKRVERLAGFSTEQMKEKLKLKAEDQCKCRDTDVRCKTMCGTLLGPEAVDVELKPPTGADE